MRRILCAVFLVCTAATLAAEQKVVTKSASLTPQATTPDVRQILKDRFHEYTEALTKRGPGGTAQNLG